MKRKLFEKEAISVLILCSLFFIPTYAHTQQVEESEAVEIAKLWYAMEYNSGHNSYAERTGLRLEDVKIAGVKYLLADDVVVEAMRQQSADVYAYFVEFDPIGWICVSSQQILTPVIAFAVDKKLRWRDPSQDGLSFTISEIANAGVQGTREAYLRGEDVVIHKNWIRFRKVIARDYDPGTIDRSNISKGRKLGGNENTDTREPYRRVDWKTAEWDQNCSASECPDNVPCVCAWNAMCATFMGGNNVPAGCNAQSYAVKMRFHKWPQRGEGVTFYHDDVDGYTYYHTVSHGGYRDWDDYSLDTITYDEYENDLVPWEHISWLLYEVGIALRSDYSLSGTSADTDKVGKEMRNHYKYNEGEYRVVTWAPPGEMSPWPIEYHHIWIRYSVFAGALPIISNEGHVMLAVGYDFDEPNGDYLHVNSNGNTNFWYTLDDLPGSGTVLDESITYQHPESHEYVSVNATAPYSGWLRNPYVNLSDVLDDLYNGPGPDGERSHLWIRGGDYPSSDNAVTIEKYTDIRSYAGSANIRDRLIINSEANNDTLETVAHIRINQGGTLIIN